MLAYLIPIPESMDLAVEAVEAAAVVVFCS
jgi:hypothetical protein